jgi:uncharacterized coiled-coil protein SlyX
MTPKSKEYYISQMEFGGDAIYWDGGRYRKLKDMPFKYDFKPSDFKTISDEFHAKYGTKPMTTQEKIKNLETRIANIEFDIQRYQNFIKDYQPTMNRLTSELNQLKAELNRKPKQGEVWDHYGKGSNLYVFTKDYDGSSDINCMSFSGYPNTVTIYNVDTMFFFAKNIDEAIKKLKANKV